MINNIPKIIWQTHEWEWKDLPLNFKKTAMSWINLNPDWEYKYYSKSERLKIIDSIDSEFSKLLINPNVYWSSGMVQADIFRYLVLKRFGGVYCDMDSFCIVPLSYMLKDIKDDMDIVTFKQASGHINNSNLATLPESETINNTIKIIKNKSFYNNRFSDCTIHPCDNWRISIDDSSEHYDECFINTYVAFYKAATNKDNVSIDFETIHADIFKKEWNKDFMINYFGKNIPYSSFIANNNLKEF